MTDDLSSPRSVDYFVLRTCERMHLTPLQFDRLPLDEQLQLLAFDRLRDRERRLETVADG